MEQGDLLSPDPTSGVPTDCPLFYNKELFFFMSDLVSSLDTLFEISQLLDTGLDKATLAVLVGLCEQGVNPEALAEVVLEIRRETANLVTQKNT